MRNFTLGMLGLLCAPVHGEMKMFLYGNESIDKIEGFIQTPQGGTVGSTSIRRPTFDEVNVHHDNFYALGGGIQYGDYFALFDYHHFSPHGSTILTQNLITHNQFIPQGGYFEMALEYDLYTVGFGKHFNISNQWTVSPALLINLLKYHYEFSSPPINSARTFSLLGADVGAKIQYDFTPKLSMDFIGAISLPLSNTKLYTAEVGFSYHFTPSAHATIIPRVAAGYFQLDYKDEQPMPNHICYTAIPHVSAGLMVVLG